MSRSRSGEHGHREMSVRASDGARLWVRVDRNVSSDDTRAPVLLLGPAEASHLRWPDAFVADLVSVVGPVIRFDYRDVGRSSKTADSYGIGRMMLDSIEVLDEVGGPDSTAHWVGFSMGSTIALHAAIDRSERLKSLALIGATPGFELGLEAPPDWLLQRMAERGLSQPSSRLDKVDWISEQLEWFSGPRLAATYDWRAQAGREVEHGWRHQHRHGEAAVEVSERSDELDQIKAKTTIVHGTADPVYPVEHAVFLHDRIAGARLELLEGIGHEIPHGHDLDLVRLLFSS